MGKIKTKKMYSKLIFKMSQIFHILQLDSFNLSSLNEDALHITIIADINEFLNQFQKLLFGTLLALSGNIVHVQCSNSDIHHQRIELFALHKVPDNRVHLQCFRSAQCCQIEYFLVVQLLVGSVQGVSVFHHSLDDLMFDEGNAGGHIQSILDGTQYRRLTSTSHVGSQTDSNTEL